MHGLGQLVAPFGCAACDTLVPSRALFCGACAASVERAASSAGAPFVYGGAVATALVRFKYAERADLAERLAHHLAQYVRERGWAFDLIVPVPLHPKRLAERGYNQAALLSVEIASELGVPCEPNALVRTRETTPQAGLVRDLRLVNTVGVFRCRLPQTVAGRNVLLVDDVRATGATLQSCAGALEVAKAASVRPVVLARSTLESETT